MSQVLVLNTTLEPLGFVDVQRAVCMLYAREAEVFHDTGQRWRSMAMEIAVPLTVRLLHYVPYFKKRVSLTKKNVLMRDDYMCAYCGEEGGRSMTVDHIQPKSRGGKNTWENLVACCQDCNGRKRDRTPAEAGMKLRVRPHRPQMIPWATVKRRTWPDEWINHLKLYNIDVGQYE